MFNNNDLLNQIAKDVIELSEQVAAPEAKGLSFAILCRIGQMGLVGVKACDGTPILVRMAIRKSAVISYLGKAVIGSGLVLELDCPTGKKTFYGNDYNAIEAQALTFLDTQMESGGKNV